MGYIAVPGSNTDLYSGTILSSQTGTAEGVDGALLCKLCIYSVIHISTHPSKELCSKMAL